MGHSQSEKYIGFVKSKILVWFYSDCLFRLYVKHYLRQEKGGETKQLSPVILICEGKEDQFKLQISVKLQNFQLVDVRTESLSSYIDVLVPLFLNKVEMPLCNF